MEEDFKDLEKKIWNLLLEGSNNLDHPFHAYTVSSNSFQGVRLRTVIHRRTMVTDKKLIFFTDVRSKKWNDWILNPNISAIFYDPKLKLQIVIDGLVNLHYNNSYWDEAWKKLKAPNRRAYMTENKPGSITMNRNSGLRQEFEKKEIRIADTEPYKNNFGVVEINVSTIEVLQLDEIFNSRAILQYQWDKTFKGTWLIP